MIMRIPILKSILRNLDWFEEAQKHHKAPEGTIFVGGINHRLKKEDWAEQKHPRADDGKFTSGSGGGSKKPSKTKRKLERRAEAASQGRVSGAIQTLLSGGSALDKIGWLNTSKPKEPEKKPESKPQQPGKPTAEEKPKQESEVDRHLRVQAERKQFIQDSSAKLLANLRSGKVTPEDAEKVRRELGHKSFDLVREIRSMKDGDELNAKIAEGKHLDDKIKAIEAALETHKKEQPAKPISEGKVRSKPGRSSVRDDPLPRGYRVRSPEETERYMREHPYKPPKGDDYEADYKRRTGRDWDPTTA
jgi:hypothetical protein